MKYRQTNSTFIPKENSNLSPNTNMDNSGVNLEDRKDLLLQIEKLNKQIKELEEEVKVKNLDLDYYGNLVVSLEDEVERLKDPTNKANTEKLSNLNLELSNMEDENTELKRKVAAQGEQLQLLYILLLFLFLI